MSLELALVSPPQEWDEGRRRSEGSAVDGASKTKTDGVHEAAAPGDGSPVVHLGVGTAWWMTIPPRIHHHLTSAAAEVVLEGMGAFGMITHSLVDPHALAALDAEAHLRFIASDSQAAGIPIYKMYTEHEWVVTPREIHTALATYAAVDRPLAVIERLFGRRVRSSRRCSSLRPRPCSAKQRSTRPRPT